MHHVADECCFMYIIYHHNVFTSIVFHTHNNMTSEIKLTDFPLSPPTPPLCGQTWDWWLLRCLLTQQALLSDRSPTLMATVLELIDKCESTTDPTGH